MPKITKRFTEAVQPQEKDYIICDDKLTGFALRVMPSGRKTFLVQYRIGSRSRRTTLGQFGIISPEQARTMALQELAAVKSGKDPSAERKAKRRASTVAELAERFDIEHISIRVKPTTASEYRRNLRRFILPAIGHLRVTEVTRADISDLHHSLSHIPYQANRNLEVVSKMFSLAELWGLRPDGSNPRRHVQKYREKKRERYLNEQEYAALGAAIEEAKIQGLEDIYGLSVIELLLHTGCRLNEIITLRWENVDIPNGKAHLPDSKTGARTIFLSPSAINVLQGLPRQDKNPWVICGKNPGKPRKDIQRFWRRLRGRATVHYWRSKDTAATAVIDTLAVETGFLPYLEPCMEALTTAGIEITAGLTDVRLHDLRHSFASSAVSQGLSLAIIGKLLGHTQVQTTARYAHLMDEPLKAAVADIGVTISKAMG